MTDETPVVVDDVQPESQVADTPAAETPEDQVAAFKAAAEAVSEADVPRETKPAEAAPVADTPAVAAPAAAAAPVVEDPKAATKAAVDADIAKFNEDLKAGGHKPLTKAAEERFRELAARPKPEDVEREIAPLRHQAERMAQWDDVVAQSTATGEEIQNALGVIQATKSGDPAREMQAADALLTVVRSIYEKNGRELPGMNDPLAAHADLKEFVESGAVTRAAALKIAADRAALTRTTERTEQLTAEQQHQASVTRARADVDVLNDQLKAADPAQFAAKLQYLIPTLEVIRDRYPPHEWVQRITAAYLKLPSVPQPVAAPVVVAPAKPRVGPVPLRPTGGNGGMRATVPEDPLAAFKLGVASLQE